MLPLLLLLLELLTALLVSSLATRLMWGSVLLEVAMLRVLLMLMMLLLLLMSVLPVLATLVLLLLSCVVRGELWGSGPRADALLPLLLRLLPG